MFQINENLILNLTNNYSTFLKGKQYDKEGLIELFEFNEKSLSFEFTAYGTEMYHITLKFREDLFIQHSDCTCPASRKYPGICKHTVACLLKVMKLNSEGEFDYLFKNTSIANDNRDLELILDFFKDRTKKQKSPVNLEINYEFRSRSHYNTSTSSLNFRIGDKKLYVIKNLRNFIHSLNSQEDMVFGKDFTFYYDEHTFKEEDLPVIDFLKEMHEIESMMKSSYHSSIFKDKRINLNPNSLNRFFSLLKERPINASVLDNDIKDIEILNEDIPLNLKLTKKKDDLILDIDLKKSLIALSPKGQYFFYKENIYKVSKDQNEYLLPFFRYMAKTNKNYVSIPKEHSENFITDVVPHIDKIGKVTIDEKVENSIYKPDLKSELYLDKKENNIVLDVLFKYDDISINPFNIDSAISTTDNRIFVRDKEKENIIMNLIEDSLFKINNDRIYIEDEENIYNFISDKLPQLQDMSDIYYSESFKSIQLKDSSSFSGSLRLNNESNLLEISFSIDGVDNLELLDVFTALKEKKRYYKLRDGSFLPLSHRELDEFDNILSSLNLDSSELNADIIKIPKFRAMYLDDELSESSLKFFKKNLDFKQLVQNIKEPNDIDYTIPDELKDTLRNYQETGFKWLKTISSYGFGGILADDMGLGKTLQTIAFLLSEKIEKGQEPSIIIAPTSLVYNWQSEIEKFAPSLKTLIISGSKSEREEKIKDVSNYDIIVTSYPLIRRDVDFYNDTNFRYCILDEAQYIKNASSLNSSSVKSINAKNKFALTGTPIENSLTELWSIFDFVMPGYLLSRTNFMKKFEKPIVKDSDRKALDKLGKHIRPFILRRLKKDVLKELPEKIENKLVAELTNEQKKVYLAYLENIKNDIKDEISNNGFERSHIKILAGLTRLRQICCHPSMFIENYSGKSGKFILLEEILTDFIDSGHRILIFSQFTSMLKIIRDMLIEKGIEFMYLDGSTPMDKRGSMVKDFNNGEGKVFLISLKAGGTGLNLTGADTVIHFDPWWNPAVEEQATDRAYRIGQENVVNVMKLITKGTIEEKIFALQEKKKKLIDSVIKPGETLVSKLSEEEIRNIFDI